MVWGTHTSGVARCRHVLNEAKGGVASQTQQRKVAQRAEGWCATVDAWSPEFGTLGIGDEAGAYGDDLKNGIQMRRGAGTNAASVRE